MHVRRRLETLGPSKGREKRDRERRRHHGNKRDGICSRQGDLQGTEKPGKIKRLKKLQRN